jgi:hypothetical protein
MTMDTRGVRETEVERDGARVDVVPAVVTTVLTRATDGVPGSFGIRRRAALPGTFVRLGVVSLVVRIWDEIAGGMR